MESIKFGSLKISQLWFNTLVCNCSEIHSSATLKPLHQKAEVSQQKNSRMLCHHLTTKFFNFKLPVDIKVFKILKI